MKSHPQLVDAERMAAEHPDTFALPPRELSYDLKPGDMAKVCLENEGGGERFWVQVLRRDEDGYVGEIANEISDFDVILGDEIRFEPRHVYDTETLSARGYTVPSLPLALSEARKAGHVLFMEAWRQTKGTDYTWIDLLCSAEVYAEVAGRFRKAARAEAPWWANVVAWIFMALRRWSIALVLGALAYRFYLSWFVL